MERALQTAKDISPLGFGLTLVVLIFQFLSERGPMKDHVAELTALNSRITTLESGAVRLNGELNNLNQSLLEVRNVLRDVKRISCAPLSASQRKVVTSCD